MRTLTFPTLLAMLCCLGSAFSQETQPQAPTSKWEQEISGLERKITAKKYEEGRIAFVGSSTMRLWKLEKHLPGWKIANIGFGGASIPDQLEFFDRLLGKLKPKQVLFYGGGNDLAQNRTPEQVVADFEMWVGKMKKLVPDCDITFLSIRPSTSRAKIAAQEAKANALVKGYCEKSGLHFLGLDDDVKKPDGTIDDSLFETDKLHLNDAGYKKLTARVLPLLDEKLR